MLLINCPHCGPPPENQLPHPPQAHLARPAPECTDAEWAEYLYMRDNPRGLHAERWRHLHGCGQFFNIVRNTSDDGVERSYPAGASR
jgi:sarcosine oxidase subunit delta